MNRIVIIGAGGHCKSVLDSIDNKEYVVEGLIDSQYESGEIVHGYRVLGDDSVAKQVFSNGVEYAFIAVGSTGDVANRKKIFTLYSDIGYKFPNIIDKTAVISKNIFLGEGNFVGKRCVINTSVTVHNQCIINTGAVIEHDCIINDYVHIAPGAVICGGVTVGNNSHIGANTTVIQSLVIEDNVIVGAGSVVINDIKENVIAYGNPCRISSDR